MLTFPPPGFRAPPPPSVPSAPGHFWGAWGKWVKIACRCFLIPTAWGSMWTPDLEVSLYPITPAMSTVSQRPPAPRRRPEWGVRACLCARGPDAALSFADGLCPMDCPTTEQASEEGGPQSRSRRSHSPPSGHCAAPVCRARTVPACTSVPAPWLSAGMTPRHTHPRGSGAPSERAR